MELKNLILSLASLMTVTGSEAYDARRLEELTDGVFDETRTDKLGNRIFVKKCGREGAPKILIDAHLDEIGMMVSDIKENGFLSVAGVGGMDARILQASDVVIYGREKIFGVVGSTPPHLQKAEESKKLKEIGELLIDTGYTSERLEELVRIGTPVGFAPKYTELANGRLAGKGFDNKSCAACAICGIAAADKPAADIYLMLSSREETGAVGGAAPGATAIDPDYAMILDVNLGRTPDTPKSETVEMGKGASVTVCPVTDRRLTNMLLELAAEKNIATQLSVTGGSTGTNTPDINLALDGIPCVDVGLPLKSMHTCSEVIDLADAQSVADLVRAFVESEKIAEVFVR